MPKKVKPVAVSEVAEAPVEQTEPLAPPNRDQYLKARALIQLYRENQKSKPKRKCSEKQLQALAEGRARNPRAQKKQPEQ